MATSITFNEITNATTLTNGTGYFDTIMKVVTLHLEDQLNKGNITSEAYANVYLGGMQSSMQLATQFALEEKLKEAQTDGALKDIEVKTAQINEMEARELATKAKILDENGIEITAENELIPSASTTTAHHFSTDLLKAQIATEEEKDDLVKAQKDAALMDSVAKRGQITQELNGEYDPTTLEWAFPGASVDTNEEINFYKSVSGANVATPYTMNMFRQLKENSIADATAKGYKADGAYKAYKSLQELLFALANAGVEASDEDIIADSANNPYKKIMLSMETLINAHIAEWYGPNILDIELTIKP